jgi:excisionase family DNA binding protein
MAKTGERRFFTTTEVARYCEVSNDGVLKWIKAGKLRAFATPGGHYRISAEDFREFLNLYAFPIQESFFSETPDVAHRTRILIVGEQPDQRKILERLIQKMNPNWILDQAGDGYEAGIKIGSIRPNVVVVDLLMKRIDGLSLCRSIRANADTRSIRILALSGDSGESTRQKALQAGADQCLPAPLDLDRFRYEVTRLLRRPVLRGARPQQQV